MYGRISVRTLAVIVVILAASYLLSGIFSQRASERTFRDHVLALDTATVTAITIAPRSQKHEPVKLERTAQGWTVTAEGRTWPAEATQVQRLLGDYVLLRSKRMVGMLEEVAERYDLADTLENRITFTVKQGDPIELHLGRSTYAPGNIGAWTYVNLDGDEEVYAVEGLLSNTADQKATAWRPHLLVKGDPVNWQRVTFTYPQDTGYVFEKTDGRWLLNGSPEADTLKISRFLRSLANARAQDFADGVDVTGLTPVYQLRIDDATRPEPIFVRVFLAPGTFVVTSSMNPDNVMKFDARDELPRMFRQRGYWF